MRGGHANSGHGRVVALCGGVGGAKLALGLTRLVAPERLSIVVNVGDDFRHFGLHVSPDIDTVLYTLSGRANLETGWGRAGESWRFMAAVEELGGETWFSLGDTDLAIHAVRTAALARGETLTAVTRALSHALGIEAAILPASDQPVETVVETEVGRLSFQRYFVEHRCAPAVRAVHFPGAAEAHPTAEIEAALTAGDLEAIVICPSNPYLSIDPILAIPGLRALVELARAPVVGVSPLVGSKALKGPLAKIMSELGHSLTPAGILSHYGDLLDCLLVDLQDREAVDGQPRIAVTSTVMQSVEDRIALARTVLDTASRLRG